MSEDKERLLAFVDLETTGLIPLKWSWMLNTRVALPHHEIIEIALVLVEARTLKIVDEWDIKVKPVRLMAANPVALDVNGYSDGLWIDACPLLDALNELARRTSGAELVCHNVSFDWEFLNTAFGQCGMSHDLHYHRHCTMSMADVMLRPLGLTSTKLEEVCKFLGITEEPSVHRALRGAQCCYEVYKKLRSAKVSLD